MKIVQCEGLTKDYGELETGETFMWAGHLYMVTDNVTKDAKPVYESVSLLDGAMSVFGEKVAVTPVICEVHVRK